MKVAKGMILVYERAPLPGSDTIRYNLLTVSSTRHLKSGAISAKLVFHDMLANVIGEYGVTFPDGEVRDPFRLFALSQNDLRHFWSKTGVVAT